MAIGRAHDRLYRSPQIDQIDMADYLAAICKDLEEVAANCHVSFESSGDLSLATDRAIGLALVVTELEVNAAKHAYPADAGGRIWVRLTVPKSGPSSVSVRDAGAGLPADFESSKSGRLGMRLTRALAKQAGGELRAERLTPGTEFILEMPPNSD